MEIGNRIKFHRLNKGMTQDDLAEGIISKSYLSKIENNQAIPAKEIIELLCEKLEIPYEESEQEDLFQTMNSWFELLLKGKKNEAVHAYSDIQDKFSKVNNSGLIKLYEIHLVRFYVITQQMEEAEDHISRLTQYYSDYIPLEKYYWHKFVGDYYYASHIYESAFEHYRNAEKYLDSKIFLYHNEKNDLYYLLSLTSVQLWKYHLGIYYAEKALSHYQNIYELLRCAQCHITIGVAYKGMGELDNAIESYKKAFIIAEATSDRALLANCHHNLGSLHFERGDIRKAIEQYLMSFEMKEELSTNKKMITVLGLIKLYYQEGMVVEAAQWIHKGRELSARVNLLDSILEMNLKLYDFLVNPLDERFEVFMLEEALPILKEKRQKKDLACYYKLLADYYFQDRKYKNACYYYQESINQSKIHITNGGKQ
ncbi:tetratricopeptide repeat protein [Mangrovibacillus sp. Mu-81]|uniref:tetratricopeptide repeat protein n=1 Tax=Mangrovibacillus sp. Mu-81 TaxID=3121478 RepID=UPI002FE47E14